MNDSDQVAAGIILVLGDVAWHTTDDFLRDLFEVGRFNDVLEYCKKRGDEFKASYPKITDRRAGIKKIMKGGMSRALADLQARGYIIDDQKPGGRTIPIKYQINLSRSARIWAMIAQGGNERLTIQAMRSEFFTGFLDRTVEAMNRFAVDWPALMEPEHAIESEDEKVQDVFKKVEDQEKRLVTLRTDLKKTMLLFGQIISLVKISPAALLVFLARFAIPWTGWLEFQDVLKAAKETGKGLANRDQEIMQVIIRLLGKIDFQVLYDRCKIAFISDYYAENMTSTDVHVDEQGIFDSDIAIEISVSIKIGDMEFPEYCPKKYMKDFNTDNIRRAELLIE
jgi:hypothetical protein